MQHDTESINEMEPTGFSDSSAENGTQKAPLTAEEQPSNSVRQVSFNLPYPISANRYWRMGKLKNSKPMMMLSKEARTYRLMCQGQYLEQFKKVLEPFKGPVSVNVTLVPPDKRRRDIDNPIKPLLDVLEKSINILSDDAQVKALSVSMQPPEGLAAAYVTITELPSWPR